MRQADNRHPVLGTMILVASLSLIAAVLTGLSATSASAGPGYQKPPAGACRYLTYAQSRAKTNSTKPVSCASKHTAQTVGVGKLSKAQARASKRQVADTMRTKCQKAFNKVVGGSASARLRSAFTLSVFAPTKAQKRKGARWFRCDATLSRGKSLTPMTTTKRPLLSSPTPTNQALCLTGGGLRTTCDATHSFKATHVFKLKGKAYPGKKKVKKAASAGCKTRVSTTSYRADWPTKAEWANNYKYVVCFSAHTLPPPPPPPADADPTTTIVLSGGSVPVGTNVTATGLATDDKAVTTVTATLTKSGGSAISQTVTQTSGGLGTASYGWSVNLGGSLTVGTYTFAVRVTDSGGNIKDATDTLTISSAPDTTKPTTSLSGPPTSLTTTTNLVISGTASDNVQVATLIVQLRNSGGNYLQDGLGSFGASNANGLPVNPTGLGTPSVSFGLDTGTRAAGTYTVEVTAEDAAGNVSNLLTRNVTVTTSTGGSEVYYAMNEASGVTVMTDTGSSGLNLNGVIDQAGLDTGIVLEGATGYQWAFTSPENPPAKPERVIQVPDNAALDAGADTFTVEVRYRTVNSFGNVMQKGQSGSVGGQWKIQQPGGYPSCLFKRRTAGEDFQISVQSTVDFSVGGWHTLRCVRAGNNVTMFVDGVYNGEKNFSGFGDLGTAGSVGTVANTVPLTIGGKINCDQIETTCDYFTGNIDYVRLTHSG